MPQPVDPVVDALNTVIRNRLLRQAGLYIPSDGYFNGAHVHEDNPSCVEVRRWLYHESPDGWGHFIAHVGKAFDVLDLRWDEVNAP